MHHIEGVKKLALGVGLALALLVIVGLALPRTVRVERAITVGAPPATVFTVLNGFRQFNRWSPWAELDPGAQYRFTGPDQGVGARMEWIGNADVGSGSQEIFESVPYTTVRVRLQLDASPGDITSRYALEPVPEGTRVTWSFEVDSGDSLLARYVGMLSEGMLGPQYENGLLRLRALVEQLPRTDFSALRFEVLDMPAQPAVMVAASSARDSRAVGVSLGVAYGRLSGFIAARGLRQIAPPLAVYHGENHGALRFDALIPVDRPEVPGDGSVRAARTPAGRVVRAIHRGPYSGLPAANAQVRAFLAAAGYRQAGPAWEQYVSDPASVPASDLITHIHYPIE